MTPQPLTIDDLAEMTEIVQMRLDRGEDLQTAIGVVLFNYGDRFATAACVAGEWTGQKHELPRTAGIPKCPNGHVLTQGPGKVLAFVDDPIADIIRNTTTERDSREVDTEMLFTVRPLAGDEVEVVARYADGSYDRSIGTSISKAMDQLGQKIAYALEELIG